MVPQKHQVAFTTMLIGVVFDQMIINRDMVLVTDIKSMEISMKIDYTLKELVSEANKGDKELLIVDSKFIIKRCSEKSNLFILSST